MPVVTRVLLDQVKQHPAQRWTDTVAEWKRRTVVEAVPVNNRVGTPRLGDVVLQDLIQ